MDVYVFVYHAKPTKGSPEFEAVGGAHVDIWVYDVSRESADLRARSYLMDLAWQVLEVERELVLNDEQIVDYREDAQANYFQAKTRGISAFFAAYPPVDRDDDVVVIRPLGKTPDGSGSDSEH